MVFKLFIQIFDLKIETHPGSNLQWGGLRPSPRALVYLGVPHSREALHVADPTT